jgi:hypothetical protein
VGQKGIAQAEVLIDEIKVVVETLTRGGFERGLLFGLVVPGPIGGTRLHGGEDMYQTGVITALGDNGLDAFFLAEGLETADEFNFKSRLSSQVFGVVAQLIAQRFCPLGIVEQSDVAIAEETGHSAGMSDIRQGAGEDDPVETRQHTGNLILVTCDKRIHLGSSRVR